MPYRLAALPIRVTGHCLHNTTTDLSAISLLGLESLGGATQFYSAIVVLYNAILTMKPRRC